MQSEADYSGAETGFATMVRYGANYGSWKYKVEWPSFYAVSSGGTRKKVGSFNALGHYSPAVPAIIGGASFSHPVYAFIPSLSGAYSGQASAVSYGSRFMVALHGVDTQTVPLTCKFHGMPKGTVCSGGISFLYWVR